MPPPRCQVVVRHREPEFVTALGLPQGLAAAVADTGTAAAGQLVLVALGPEVAPAGTTEVVGHQSRG